MMLLASITGSAPVDIAAWMGCAYFAVSLWNALNKAIDRNRVKPEPSETYATKPELAEVRKEVKAVDTDVRSLRREIVDNGDKRKASIEGKVQEVNTAMIAGFLKLTSDVSALAASTRKQDEQLLVIAGRLNNLTDGRKHH